MQQFRQLSEGIAEVVRKPHWPIERRVGVVSMQ
jgi:hypothetical protein